MKRTPGIRLRTRALVACTFVGLLAAVPGAGTQLAQAAKPAPAPRVLVYSGTESFRHPVIDQAKTLLKTWSKSKAFTVDFTEKKADITIARLSAYDMVLWLSPSGVGVPQGATSSDRGPAPACKAPDQVNQLGTCTRAPFTAAQRQDVVDYLQCGGGFVGIHQVLDAWHDWPEWDEATGFVFINHFQPGEAMLRVEGAHPAAAAWGKSGSEFKYTEEFYAHFPDQGPNDLSSNVVPLLTIGSFTNPTQELSQGAGYAEHQLMAWTSTFRGKNRTFITALGHDEKSWNDPRFKAHVVNGIKHVAGKRPNASCLKAAAKS